MIYDLQESEALNPNDTVKAGASSAAHRYTALLRYGCNIAAMRGRHITAMLFAYLTVSSAFWWQAAKLTPDLTALLCDGDA